MGRGKKPSLTISFLGPDFPASYSLFRQVDRPQKLSLDDAIKNAISLPLADRTLLPPPQPEKEKPMSRNANGTKARHATTKETSQIIDLLREYVVVKENGFCEFKNSMTDNAIARLVAPDLRTNHVSRIRLELFGRLIERAGRTELEMLRDDHENLKARFDALVKALGHEEKLLPL